MQYTREKKATKMSEEETHKLRMEGMASMQDTPCQEVDENN
jgi:hypothetical protein